MGTSLWSTLEGWHRSIGSPLVVEPGPDPEEVAVKLGWAEVEAGPALVEFLTMSPSWGGAHPDLPVQPMPGWSFPGLDHLVHEAEYLSTVRRTEVSAWSDGWFPLFRDRTGRLIVIDTAMGDMAWLYSELDAGSVYPLADSMGELGERLVDALAPAGWDPRFGYQGVTTSDFVERLRMFGAEPATSVTVDLTVGERATVGS